MQGTENTIIKMLIRKSKKIRMTHQTLDRYLLYRKCRMFSYRMIYSFGHERQYED